LALDLLLPVGKVAQVILVTPAKAETGLTTSRPATKVGPYHQTAIGFIRGILGGYNHVQPNSAKCPSFTAETSHRY
jgi:hypothetical protein